MMTRYPDTAIRPDDTVQKPLAGRKRPATEDPAADQGKPENEPAEFPKADGEHIDGAPTEEGRSD